MKNDIVTILDKLNTEQTKALLDSIELPPAPVSMQRRLIRRACAITGLRNRTVRPWWLIPVAAALAAGVAVASIPDARAAVALFFDRLFRIERYMMEDKEDRPQIEAIEAIIQTPMSAEDSALPNASENNHALFSYISEDAPFLNDINIKVTETLYDGQELIISAVITGDIDSLYDGKTGELSQVYGISSDCPITLTDKNGNTQTLSGIVDIIPPASCKKEYGNKADNQGVAVDQIKIMIRADNELIGQNNSIPHLTGMQTTELRLQFIKMDQGGGHMKTIGLCTLNYGFDATAGSESITTSSPNQTVELSGQALVTETDWSGGNMIVKNTELPLKGGAVKVDMVNFKSTGITLKLLYRAPNGWTPLQQESFQRGEGTSLGFRVLINGEDTGSFMSSSGRHDDVWRYAFLEIPVTGDDQAAIETLEVLPVVYHLTEVNGVSVTGEAQRIPIKTEGSESGWTQKEDFTALTWNQFAIELP